MRFKLVNLEYDELRYFLQVSYPSMLNLLDDLQLMGESNCSIVRPLTLRRDITVAASAIYQVDITSFFRLLFISSVHVR